MKNGQSYLVVAVFCIFVSCNGQSDVRTATVCQTIGDFVKIDENCSRIVAKASFTDKINSTGWSFLELETFGNVSDEVQAYAAGIAEGYITRQLINWHWRNTVAGYCTGAGEYCNRLNDYLNKNTEWIKLQIASNPTDPYWHQVKLMMIQLSGLEDGFYKIVTKPHFDITAFGFIMFQLSGDLEDLEEALNKPQHLRKTNFGRESCSAFVMPLPKNEDIYFAHVTWSTYQSMLRIQKLYKFAYSRDGNVSDPVPSQVITFSSYPGTLMSIDDFYLLQSGLAVTETTIGNSNSSLYKFITPGGTVLSWIRVMVANRLATGGQNWMDIFKKRNSGTYNNQFMILDYNKFKPGKELPKSGLFFVLEQIPGLVEAKDMTVVLKKQGYWPSYNVPYYKNIFNLSGNLDNVAKYGDWFTYEKTPRALIFARDWQKVRDMASLTKLMRYNNFRVDPLSVCNCTPPYSAENAISARNDLNLLNGTYPFKQLGHRSHGATDMKATNWNLFQKLQFIGISGPTFDNLEPFQWSKQDFATTTPHFGHPDLFRFDPVLYQWATSTN